MPSIKSRGYALLMRAFMKKDMPAHYHPSPIRKRVEKLASQYIDAPRGIDVDSLAIPASASGPQLTAERFTSVGHYPGEPLLLYLHGGGYVICSPRTHRSLVGHLCMASGAGALALDYRKAPEHPFPAPIEDAVRTYGWLLEQGHEPGRIVIAGDSAGGGLTLATLIKLRELGLPQPAGAVVISPWTDLALTGNSIVENRRRDAMLTRTSIQWAASHYLQEVDPEHPLASPLYAELHGLPPMLVTASTTEMLRDDAVRLVRRARAHGVNAHLRLHRKTMHAFQVFVGTAEARRSIREIGDFVADVTRRARAVRGAVHPPVASPET